MHFYRKEDTWDLGPLNRRKIIILMSCLLLTAYGVHYRNAVSTHKKSNHLGEQSIFAHLNSWKVHKQIPLSDRIVEALELDDYVNRSFTRGRDTVSLYIGFYATQKKVGAAHSPLVCFPGQGWNLSNFSDLIVRAGRDRINLMSMVIGKGEEQQLVLYWFQAYDQTSPGTFMQKVYLLMARFLHAREDNAFVRLMIPFGRQRTREEAMKTGIQFIQDFYPGFKNYITR